MNGRERTIIIAVVLILVLAYAAANVILVLNGTIDADKFDGRYNGILLFAAGLLVKLPQTKEEVEATANTTTSIENMNAEVETLTATEK
jgi:hypothetical protein